MPRRRATRGGTSRRRSPFHGLHGPIRPAGDGYDYYSAALEADIIAGIRKVGDQIYEIDRSTITTLLEHAGEIRGGTTVTTELRIR